MKKTEKTKNLKKQPLPDHETNRKTFWPSLNAFRRQSESPEYPVKVCHVTTRGQTGNRTNRTVTSVHSDNIGSPLSAKTKNQKKGSCVGMDMRAFPRITK